jgi:quercetin dioxygenase-like cupin family protein
MSFDRDGYALARGEGTNLWFFNSLLTVKAGGEQTGNAWTLCEILSPPDFGPPPHVHEHEDEAFYVLEGEMSFTCGEKAWTAGPGSYIHLPRRIAHGFTTWSTGPVRMLQLSSPSQFEHYAADLGEPASQLTLPQPQPPDITRLREVSARYGIEFMLAPTGG